MAPSEDALHFRPLRAADLPLLGRWLSEGPALAWYAGGAAPSPQDLARKHLPRIRGETGVHGFILVAGAADAGYFQYYRLRDAAGHPAQARDPDGAGIDFLLAQARIGQGLGPPAIRAFAREVFAREQDVTACWADPHPRNVRSVRALSRAGFLPCGESAQGAAPALLLRLGRAEAGHGAGVSSSQVLPPFEVR